MVLTFYLSIAMMSVGHLLPFLSLLDSISFLELLNTYLLVKFASSVF